MDAGGAELVLLSPAEAPDGDRILLGVDAVGVAYFAVLGPLPDPVLFADLAQDSGTGGKAGADETPGPDRTPGVGHASVLASDRPGAERGSQRDAGRAGRAASGWGTAG